MTCANCEALAKNQIDSETFLCDGCLNEYIILNRKDKVYS